MRSELAIGGSAPRSQPLTPFLSAIVGGYAVLAGLGSIRRFSRQRADGS